ncbi:hypothetical protein [Egbenema bharatensis]|uniref:hypothetical protein n=1 Tax=Egbenema bharatensis TaxID=3463334 RepID=UPI003A880A2C
MFKRSTKNLDRTALTLIVILSLAIGFLLTQSGQAIARVRDFTWQARQVGAADSAFILSFSRPMDKASVEENLQIDPPLPGKFSWAGRRMAYTLESPIPYGQTFELSLKGGRDRFSPPDDARLQMRPFTSEFQSRDRVFVYLGVEGDEAGRLVLLNLTRQEQKILTPPNLLVMDFKPYPENDRILFSAIEQSSGTRRSLGDQQLYTVSTGIRIQPPDSLIGAVSQRAERNATATPQSAGVVELVLDNRDYQNLKFDLSPNGKTIVVQRVNQQNPADFGLWILQPGEPARPIETEPGGDFLIAPDSQSLAMSQGQGMAILPLESGADPLDFLPRYGMILSFARDGTAAAMVRFNRNPENPTRSLFLITNQGTEQELLEIDGSFLDAQFDPNKRNLYCLLTRRIPGDVYLEQPYLTAINLDSGEVVDLLKLPIQQDIQMNLSPDGLAVLFDQAISDADVNADGVIRGRDGKAIASSKLWILPIVEDDQGIPLQAQPQEVGVAGLRPRWLP